VIDWIWIAWEIVVDRETLMVFWFIILIMWTHGRIIVPPEVACQIGYKSAQLEYHVGRLQFGTWSPYVLNVF